LAVALRIARKHGKSILLSRDKVHTHDRGVKRRPVGLLRLEISGGARPLGVESPAAKLGVSLFKSHGMACDLRACLCRKISPSGGSTKWSLSVMRRVELARTFAS